MWEKLLGSLSCRWKVTYKAFSEWLWISENICADVFSVEREWTGLVDQSFWLSWYWVMQGGTRNLKNNVDFSAVTRRRQKLVWSLGGVCAKTIPEPSWKGWAVVCAGDFLAMVAAAISAAGRVQKNRDKPSVCEPVHSLVLPVVNDLSGGKEGSEGTKRAVGTIEDNPLGMFTKYLQYPLPDVELFQDLESEPARAVN